MDIYKFSSSENFNDEPVFLQLFKKIKKEFLLIIYFCYYWNNQKKYLKQNTS